VIAVAMPGEVEGRHAELVCERGSHGTPPVRVRSSPVHEDQAPPARVAPGQVVNGRPCHLDPRIGRGHGDGAGEPGRGAEGHRGLLAHTAAGKA
jgi:hypothetical protein